jgi:hypothetical protein
MTFRLAIHVGPHKTGSTSVQRALAAAREELAAGGVWYPPSLPDASWPEQHADVWLLLRDGRVGEFDAWLAAARAEAVARGCDTVLLSSENFHVPGTWIAFRRSLARFRRRTRCETRLVYVRRKLVDLACSRALSHLAGEAGFYFLHRYDLRSWAKSFALQEARHRGRFRRRGARFVDADTTPRPALAAAVLEAATDRLFPGIVTGEDNTTRARLDNRDETLTYALRVMHRFATGTSVNTPAAFAAAVRVVQGVEVDDGAWEALLEGFRAGVEREVRAGIADYERLGPIARAWCGWRTASVVRGRRIG